MLAIRIRTVVMTLALGLTLATVAVVWADEPRIQRGTDGCRSKGSSCSSSGVGSAAIGGASAYSGSLDPYYAGSNMSDGMAGGGEAVAVMGAMAAAYLVTKAVFSIFDMIFDSPPKPAARPAHPKPRVANDTGPSLCDDPSRPGCEHMQAQRTRHQASMAQAEVQAEYSNRLGRAFASLENPWARRSDGSSAALPNPWADAQGGMDSVGADLGNPWDDDPASRRARAARCSKVWSELTEQLSALSDKASSAYKTCYAQGTAEGNRCAESTMPPIYEEMRALKASREQEMSECRSWVATKQYEKTANGAKMAKRLYDKAVGTDGFVRQIQNAAIREINSQNVNTLHNLDRVLRGMDELGNPWAASAR